MSKKTNVQTNLLGRKARYARSWGPPIDKSPMGMHWDEWGEVVVVHSDEEGAIALTIRWEDGTLSHDMDAKMIEVESGLFNALVKGLNMSASLTSMVEQGNTLVLDAVISGLEKRRAPSSMIDNLKKARDTIRDGNRGSPVTVDLGNDHVQDFAIRTRHGLTIRVCEWDGEECTHLEIFNKGEFPPEDDVGSPEFYLKIDPGERFEENKKVKAED